MERQKFEGSWKDAFDQAEVSPSEKVWTNIELDLERAESGKIKRRLLFYKMLAAASVFFGMCIGGAGIYMVTSQQNAGMVANLDDQQPQHDPLTSTFQKEENAGFQAPAPGTQERASGAMLNESETLTPESVDKNFTNKTQLSFSAVKEKSNPVNRQSGNATNSGKSASGESSRQATAFVNGSDNSAVANTIMAAPEDETARFASSRKEKGEIAFRDRQLPALVNTREIAVEIKSLEAPVVEPDPLEMLLASYEIEKTEGDKKARSSGEKFWTSVGVTAGPFNSINSSIRTGTNAANVSQNAFVQSSPPVSNTIQNETKASGIAYSVGFQLGGKVATRWTVQGGVNYLTQSSEYISSVIVEDHSGNLVAGNSNQFARQGTAEKVHTTASHTVNNNMRFVSIPVQTGFILLNKSFGIQVNGGVSTDMFLQNTITPQGDDLEKVTEKSGSDSPYRSVNFSGLFNTEFSYRVTNKYRIAVSPGIRYPFNSIYKSDLGLQSTPLTFDMGLKFRYIFN